MVMMVRVISNGRRCVDLCGIEGNVSSRRLGNGAGAGFFLFFSGSETFGEGIARPALSVQFPRQCLAVREYHDADWQCRPLRSSDSLFDGWL